MVVWVGPVVAVRVDVSSFVTCEADAVQVDVLDIGPEHDARFANHGSLSPLSGVLLMTKYRLTVWNDDLDFDPTDFDHLNLHILLDLLNMPSTKVAIDVLPLADARAGR